MAVEEANPPRPFVSSHSRPVAASKSRSVSLSTTIIQPPIQSELLAHTLSTVPRDQSGPHAVTINADENPTGKNDVENSQKRSDDKFWYGRLTSADNGPHVFKDV